MAGAADLAEPRRPHTLPGLAPQTRSSQVRAVRAGTPAGRVRTGMREDRGGFHKPKLTVVEPGRIFYFSGRSERGRATAGEGPVLFGPGRKEWCASCVAAPSWGLQPVPGGSSADLSQGDTRPLFLWVLAAWLWVHFPAVLRSCFLLSTPAAVQS